MDFFSLLRRRDLWSLDRSSEPPLPRRVDVYKHLVVAERLERRTIHTMRRRSTYLKSLPEGKVIDGIESKVKRNLWRDFCVLVFACIAMTAIGYVETHAPDEQRAGMPAPATNHGIVDTGFTITTPIHDFLLEHRHWNDIFAGLNSLVLFIPGLYGLYTVFVGDFSYIFRLLFTQMLRSFCGWCTYLPPSASYIMSYYDFPDIMQCLFVEDCSARAAQQQDEGSKEEILPFVSFFSGHVATMVICANHMYLTGHVRWAFTVHFFNVLQMVRLLATRGHYSIDMIIGWVIAVKVSDRAGRLGRYYSRGDSLQDVLPSTATEAFESITGVHDVRNEQRLSHLLKHSDIEQMLRAVHQHDEETQGLLDGSSHND